MTSENPILRLAQLAVIPAHSLGPEGPHLSPLFPLTQTFPQLQQHLSSCHHPSNAWNPAKVTKSSPMQCPQLHATNPHWECLCTALLRWPRGTESAHLSSKGRRAIICKVLTTFQKYSNSFSLPSMSHKTQEVKLTNYSQVQCVLC